MLSAKWRPNCTRSSFRLRADSTAVWLTTTSWLRLIASPARSIVLRPPTPTLNSLLVVETVAEEHRVLVVEAIVGADEVLIARLVVRHLALGRRHQRRRDHRRLVGAHAFVGGEVVHPIALDRPAEEPAEPLLAERGLARALRLRKRILRVERLVAMEQEPAAAQLVGAGARDDADDGAGRVAVLGGELVGDDDVLADRFHRQAAARAGQHVVLVAHAVDAIRVVATQLAAGVDAAAADAGHARRGLRERRERAARAPAANRAARG